MDPVTGTGASVRVLMLEDNEADVELILSQIKRDGLAVVERVVVDEHAFRLALAQFAPRVILSDFSLPRFDGLTALKIARAEAPTIPFVFVSGTLGEERAIEALKSGASDYVLKENLKRLVPSIRNAIRQAELEKANRVSGELLRRSESRLQDIINTSADWIWECDDARRFTFSSPSVGEMLGYSRHEVLGRNSLDYVDASDRLRLDEAFAAVLEDGAKPTSMILRWSHRGGEPRWLERKMVALRTEDGTPKGFRGIDRDVTSRVAQEARIARLNRALRFLGGANAAIVRIRKRRELVKETCRLAVQIGGYGMATVYLRPKERNEAPIVCRAVSGAQALAKRPPSEPIDGTGPVGRAMASAEVVIVPDLSQPSIDVPDREALLNMGLRACIALPFVIDGTPIGAALLHTDESDAFTDAELNLLRRVTGNMTFALQYLHNKESIEYLEYFDTLTALANRSLYVQRLDRMIAAAKGEDKDLVLLVFDIAGLTVINDGLGHHAGDLVLQLVAERMKNLFRDSNCLCYLGGGRYAVASTHVHDVEVATTVLRERVDFLFDQPFVVDQQELRLSIRAGFAQFPEDGADAEALLHHAETALDHAKQAGNRYVRHDPAMNVAASAQLSLTNGVRAAVERREFALHYQLKVDVATRKVEGVETLLRWPAGAVAPNIFIPVLESTGLIEQVGSWLLERAMSECASWPSGGANGALRVAVNVSPFQLRHAEFADKVLAALTATGFAPWRLELEVTESMLMTDPLLAGAILGRLRDHGVTVAIDDFGTGHSSLQVLARLPVDVLKIDRSFIGDLATNQRHRLVVQTTITLAQSLGIKTVAEGVEAEEQVDILRKLGCNLMQGFLIHRPAPADAVASLLDAWSSRVDVGRARPDAYAQRDA
jgi:diguanylate cyclase (GGDEF)-like protein/PAS domain S-box-containing protein